MAARKAKTKSAVKEDRAPYGSETGVTHPLRFIDLFCGIGGFRYAFESVGAKCVFSSDWDKYSQITYEANFGEKPHGDIHAVAVAGSEIHADSQALGVSAKLRQEACCRRQWFWVWQSRRNNDRQDTERPLP